jgi:hypothetical protein
MALGVFSQAEELLLVGLSVPLDDGLVLGAGVDMGGGQLKSSDAERMSLVLYGLLIAELRDSIGEVLVESVLLPVLNNKPTTYYCCSCSATA